MSSFVGRHRQLRELDDVLHAAVAGNGELVLVSGEPGIGKTRLCEELADRAAARGATVAWARCWQTGTVPTLWSWDQLMGQLTGRELLGTAGASVRGDPDLARMRLFEGVVVTVGHIASERPLLLVVDDLHWADLGSVRLLAYLAPRVRDMPLLLVGTFREGEAGPGTSLGDAIADLGRYGRHIHLVGLGPDDVSTLVRSVAGEASAATAATAAAVHHHTGGNPLFARELVRLLDAQGSLGDLAKTADAPPVPATVRGVLARRLGGLSPGCRTMLETGAVAGDEFGLDVVQSVTGMSKAQLLDALSEAVRTGVLREAGVGSYAFTHPLVRATLYQDLGVARRVRLHERVGVALEGAQVAGHDVDLATLAHHFISAAPGGGAARAARYAMKAAAEAMCRLAYESAVHLYQQALGALEIDPAGAERGEVLLGLGGAQVAAGNLRASRATYLQAADLARAAGRADQLARAALGVGSGGGFEVALADREQLDLLEEARRALGHEPSALLAWVTARLSVALSLSDSNERRLRLSEDALSMARAVNDQAVLAYALSAHCDAIAGPADTDRRLRESTEIVELGVTMGDRATELLGRRLRLVALAELGDIQSVDTEIDAYARLADVIRQPLYSWYVPLWRGMRALMRGELAACGRLAQEAAGVGASCDSENAYMLSETLRWYVLRESGLVEDLAAEKLAAFEPLLGAQLRVTVTLMLADAGRVGEARARLDADAGAIQATPLDSEWLPMLGQLAQAVWLAGGHPLAEWAYQALLPHRRLFVVEGIGAAWAGSVERALGLLAATLGRMGEAADHLDAALVADQSTGAPLFAARTLRDAGLALDDRERLASALATYRQLGVEQRVAELEALLEQPAVETPAGEPVLGQASVPFANTFKREGEVWTLGYAAKVVRLKDAKGLHDLALLLSQPGREVAALDLAGGAAAPRQRDLGEVIDAQARDAYKARLVELEVELDEADAAGDIERSALAQEERDAILAQLSAAYGLGRRPRRSGDTAERARQAVTWRIRDTIKHIESAHPEMGRHLRRSVRTGTFCVYDPADPVDWSL